MPPGASCMTSSGNLLEKGIKNIIHTVGPKYEKEDDDVAKMKLRNSVISVLDLAND